MPRKRKHPSTYKRTEAPGRCRLCAFSNVLGDKHINLRDYDKINKRFLKQKVAPELGYEQGLHETPLDLFFVTEEGDHIYSELARYCDLSISFSIYGGSVLLPESIEKNNLFGAIIGQGTHAYALRYNHQTRKWLEVDNQRPIELVEEAELYKLVKTGRCVIMVYRTE